MRKFSRKKYEKEMINYGYRFRLLETLRWTPHRNFEMMKICEKSLTYFHFQFVISDVF